jgi:pyruvate dehydrogenase kinase 2/3/4
MYSTAPNPRSNDHRLGVKETPVAGLGYGLPIARLYARYFQGNLTLASVENLGTSAYVSLKVNDFNSIIRLVNFVFCLLNSLRLKMPGKNILESDSIE